MIVISVPHISFLIGLMPSLERQEMHSTFGLNNEAQDKSFKACAQVNN